MGLFNQFPFTNFHEMNLDWVISNVKNIPSTVNSAIADYIKNNPIDRDDSKTKIVLSCDYENLQSAVNAAGVYGVVIITPGSYVLHEPLVINYSTSLIGMGFGDVSITCNSDFSGEYAIIYKMNNNHELSGTYITGFRLFCNNYCSGIFIDGSVPTNANTMDISFLDIRNSKTKDFVISNTNNRQGLPASTTFHDSLFWNGISLEKAGDNITIRNNYFEGTECIYYDNVDFDGGTSSVLNILNNRFLTIGKAININTGNMIKMEGNNIEKQGSYADNTVNINICSFIDINGNYFSTLANAPILSMLNIVGSTSIHANNNNFNFGTDGVAVQCTSCDYIEIENNGYSSNITEKEKFTECNRITGNRYTVSTVGTTVAVSSLCMITDGYINVDFGGNTIPAGGFASINFTPSENIDIPAIVIREGTTTIENITLTTSGYFINNGNAANSIYFSTKFKYIYKTN